MNTTRLWLGAFTFAAGAAFSPAVAMQNGALAAATIGAVESGDTTAEWSAKLWAAAKGGDDATFQKMLGDFSAKDAPAALVKSIERLREHYAAREVDRGAKITKAREELTKKLGEKLGEGQDAVAIAKALVSAMELYDLSIDKQAVLREAGVSALAVKADTAAREAEAKGQWLTASELFVRLQLLMEEVPEGVKYKKDVERVSHRLNMLRMYVPKRLWELQNERRVAGGEGKPLPPYNAVGDEYSEKLKGIETRAVVDALTKSAYDHVDLADFRRILLGSIEGIRTLLTTTDLGATFPGIADETARNAMMATLAKEEDALRKDGTVDQGDCDRLLKRVITASNETVKVPEAVICHEFGNGGIDTLDEFTAIIWPYEIARFNKMTQGSFVGIGVQIEFDEASFVRVVTPIDGTPAQRAGVKPGDLITKVGGNSIFGLSLDQVVDQITGPRGSMVAMTVERKEKLAADAPAGAEAAKSEIEFQLKRDKIKVATVKGWKKTGVGEHEWSWFIDPESHIGYVRVQQFSETTGEELAQAVSTMQHAGAGGLKGLVVDLRFNPGGLLDQAVAISRMFIDQGPIVMTRGSSGRIEDTRKGDRSSTLTDTPVVVLINRGSASASEIVSGAIQYYGNKGDIPALVLGQRSYGKGSVQQVMNLTGNKTMMKLTSQYYLLPDGRVIHRKPGAKTWGVEPNFGVEMIPQQIADGLTFRRNADVLVEGADPANAPNPSDLIEKNLDLQLEAALVLLEGQVAGGHGGQAHAER